MPRSRAAGRRSKAGFVLVEMLVAMAVGAFLLVALASVTAFLLRSHDRLMAGAQEAENAARALAALRRDIGRAAPVRWAGRGAGFVFSGTPDRLLLARAVAAADGLDAMTAVLFEARAGQRGSTLLRTEASLPPDAGGPGALALAPPAAVYAGPSRVGFAYFMRLDGGGEALLDEWMPGDEMPVAVRVTFAPAAPGARALSLRIPFMIDAEPACALPDAKGCGKPADEPETGGENAAAAAPVDSDDPLGWDRYAR